VSQWSGLVGSRLRLRRHATPKPGRSIRHWCGFSAPFESFWYLVRSSWGAHSMSVGTRAVGALWLIREKETTCRWKCMAGGMSGPELRRYQCCGRSWLCPCESIKSSVCNRNGVGLSSIGCHCHQDDRRFDPASFRCPTWRSVDQTNSSAICEAKERRGVSSHQPLDRPRL
jgi:hypothetical protein